MLAFYVGFFFLFSLGHSLSFSTNWWKNNWQKLMQMRTTFVINVLQGILAPSFLLFCLFFLVSLQKYSVRIESD